MKEKFTSLNLSKWGVESGQNEVLSEFPQNRFSDPDSETKVLGAVPSRKIAPEDKIDFPTNINSTEIANMASTLAELRESMIKYDGCSLKNTAMNIVFGDGDEKSDVMLIGEAPGADEYNFAIRSSFTKTTRYNYSMNIFETIRHIIDIFGINPN